MSALKYSRQREAIKHFLIGRTDHPTADVVYTNLREIFPNISLGTVYRNLSLLADIGEIQRIPTGNGADHYDATVDPHLHFVCKCCNQVLDLEIERVDTIMEAASKNFAGRIESYLANFYGICEECLTDE